MAEQVLLIPDEPGWSAELAAYLEDRPGSLARLARSAARHDANITRFVFNRSESPNRVALRFHVGRASSAGALVDDLRRRDMLTPRDEDAEDAVPDPEAVLTMKVRLLDQPGTLADFAELIAGHAANVIFLRYDQDVAPGQCEMTMAAPTVDEASALLRDLAEAGYDFHVEYRGSDHDAYRAIIGLSAVEVFFLRLRAMLPGEERDELRKLVESSDQCRRDLIQFRRESAQSEESLAASQVFENILELATMSLRKLGPRFTLRVTGPIRVSPRCRLSLLSAPTGGNCYLLDVDDRQELVAVDTGYGLYYEDWKAWIASLGYRPERLRRIALTHGDTDHAGFAGALEEEFGAQVFAHPGVERVFAEGNRAAGSDTPLSGLNAHFTRLVNAFTRARHPKDLRPFEPAEGERNGLPLLGSLTVGDLRFEVLESLGGHTPGQVFLLEPSAGLLFSGDYLIDFGSLSDYEKARLSVPKYLMVSTNADSKVFSREMAMLQRIMLDLARAGGPGGPPGRILPGHGDLYHVDEALVTGAWKPL